MLSSEVLLGLNWANFVLSCIYIVWAIVRYRATVRKRGKATTKQVCAVGASICVMIYYLCVVIHQALYDLFCGLPEDNWNRTCAYEKCKHDLDHPWINTIDQIGISGILIWAQIFLSAVLGSVLVMEWQKKVVRRMCFAIAFLECVTGCLLAWRIARLGVVIMTAIDLLWIGTIVVVSIRRFNVVLRMKDKAKIALSADLVIRSLLYMTVLVVFYVAYLWAKAVPKQVARSLYHPIAWISLLPTLEKVSRLSNALTAVFTAVPRVEDIPSTLKASSALSWKRSNAIHPSEQTGHAVSTASDKPVKPGQLENNS